MGKIVSFAAELEGFDEVRRGLARIAGDNGKTYIKEANKRIGDMVVDRSKRRARSLSPRSGAGSPLGRMYAKLAGEKSGIRAAQQQTRALIRIGGARVPYALGAEWGAKQFRQFAPWRGNQHPSTRRFPNGVGYVVQPTLRASETDIRDEYQKVYAEAFRRFLQ